MKKSAYQHIERTVDEHSMMIRVSYISYRNQSDLHTHRLLDLTIRYKEAKDLDALTPSPAG